MRCLRYGLIFLIGCCLTSTAAFGIDISDNPMESKITAPPPNIMIVYDNSGSMDWEFLTPGDQGRFNDDTEYVFDDAGDNTYKSGDANGTVLNMEQRKLWKSQFFGFNTIYYNPKTQYLAWPNLSSADARMPRSNPVHADPVFDLSSTYVELPVSIISDVIVDNLLSGQVSGTFVKSLSGWDLSDTGRKYGKDCYYTSHNDDPGHLAWAKWIPDAGKMIAGKYEVYAWWKSTDARLHSVTYSIVHAGSRTDASVDQHTDAKMEGQWNLLGKFEFTGDGTEYVMLTTTQTGDNKYCADAIRFCLGREDVGINRAHYYTYDDSNGNDALDPGETIYLVNFNYDDHRREWYVFKDANENDKVDPDELTMTSESSLPETVIRAKNYDPEGKSTGYQNFDQEIQNFANWYSFGRKREYVAKSVISKVVKGLSQVYLGIYTINPTNGFRSGILPIQVKTPFYAGDKSDDVLAQIYDIESDNSTPLRDALDKVGQYFSGKDTTLTPYPYAPVAEGGECQQSFCIVLSDGYWNGSTPSGIGNQDGHELPPYADTYADTLADVAMKYYRTDLSGMGNKVPQNSCDKADYQHMVTYTVSLGLLGSLVPSHKDGLDNDLDGAIDEADEYDPCFSCRTTPLPVWPKPEDNKPSKIDDLWHAAVNGRGLFFNASKPEELLDALNRILDNIEQKALMGSSVAINTDKLTHGSVVYQTGYDTQNWTGEITAFPLDPTTGQALTEKPLWKASEQYAYLTADGRRIVTYDPKIKKGIEFQAGRLNEIQKTFLEPTWSTNPELLDQTIDYIRGKDADGFRKREHILGDIVHAAPFLVGNTLYVGANDGMLHALDVGTGEERFAYIPNLVFDHLADLKNINYADHHRFYVDQTPYARFNVTIDSRMHRTVLVGGLQKGGRGIYALDITDADSVGISTSESTVKQMVLWEYPNSELPDPDLGYSYSRVFVVRSNSPTYPWIVIFGNGYNSPNSHSVLYILDAASGTVIRKIDTQVSADNGLSTPALLDVDMNQTVDFVYAGDLKGNMFKFDLTSGNTALWDVAYKHASGTPAPLFSAPDQPITIQPEIMMHPTAIGRMVFWGTGKYYTNDDTSDSSLQTLYGIWDYGDPSDDRESVGTLTNHTIGQLSSGLFLLKQQVAKTDGKYKVLTDRLPADPYTPDVLWPVKADSDSTQRPDPAYWAGWFYDLPESRERVIQDVIVRDNHLIAMSFVPDQCPCTFGGTTFIHEMSAQTGGRLDQAQLDIPLSGDPPMVTDGSEKLPPTIKAETGMLYPPRFIFLPDGKRELKLFGSSTGKQVLLYETAQKRGFSYWIEHFNDK